jgi:hypothetical protein
VCAHLCRLRLLAVRTRAGQLVLHANEAVELHQLCRTRGRAGPSDRRAGRYRWLGAHLRGGANDALTRICDHAPAE